MKSNAHKVLVYCSIVILTITSAFGQEICTNGMDDDGDGFIDCFDGDCAGGLSCADFFYGNPIVCRDEPTDNPTFQMRLQWGSADRTSDSHATPAVGDMDNDGIPEVVAINRLDETMFILDGQTGATKFTVDVGYRPENGIALANLDGGDCAYVFISEDNGRTITAYDCEANLVWEEDASDRVGIMGIADFNGDGNAEIYYKTEIMDAATGNIIVPGTSDNWVQNYAHSAIAVDILDDGFCPDCSGLELITGNEIWAIDIASGSRTLAKDLNDLFAAEVPVNNRRYFTKYFNTSQNRTAISVADYNLDGHVDVLMPGAYGTSNSSQTTIFFWDVFNDAYLVYDEGVNHNKGTGRLNVSDIDGDGQMNTTYVSDEILYALDENLGVLWTKGIDEGSSGFTGTTVFDFDGDGAAETIYRSENYLYIIDGTNGDTRTTVPCVSRTQEEYPLVADVDNDGSSELCVPCYTSDNTPFGPYNNTRFSQIRIYEADGGEIWQPSRRVWNQHGYFVVNVNDDLTIPAQQQDHTAIFGTENCETGAPEDVRALNGFLNQSTFLEADGCPSYVSPDVNMAGNINATPAVCPSTTFEVSFDIENTGDTDIFGTLPVTFYSGDPETPGATKLNTETVVINNFLEGETLNITMTVEGPGGDFDLYIVINNSGQDPPITLSGGGFPECDFGNNIGNTSVTYTPFDLTVNKLEDNRRCDLTRPDNGEAEAYFEGTLGGQYESIWVEDFTGLDNGDRSDAGPTAWTSARGSVNPRYWGVNVEDGNKLYRTRNTGNNNEVGGVEWLSEVIDITGYTDVDITLEMITNNRLEASGGARDVMRVFYILDGAPEVQFDTNGEMFGSFMYAIAEQQDLNGSTLQIRVTFHTTGNGEFQYLDNIRVSGESLPVVQQFTDADGWEFYWYNAGDFSTILNSGSLYPGMATGSYDVVGFYPGGNCYSDTVNIVINDSVPSFNVHIYEVSPQTNCVNPDGALSAFVYTQTDGSGDPLDTITNGYTFEWLRTTELITPIATGPDLTNITSEGFTVRVEQLITGCTSSAASSVSSLAVNPPDPTAVPTDITACSGAGSTGSASANVGGITAGYDFEWFYENIDATPDYTGSTISGLLEGTYFVRAIDIGSSCESNFVTFDIQDLSGTPSPVASSVDNTSCVAFTGQVSADGDGAGTTTGYNFTWYAGKNDDSNNILPGAIPGATASADGSTISNLPGGYYTVVVEQGGCVGADTVFVDENFVIPEFTFNTPVDTEESLVLTNNGYVELPQLFGPGNLITDAVTISYWANFSIDNYNNDERIFSSGATGEGQVLLWSDNHNGLAFVVRTSSGGRGRINSGYSATGWAQVVGTWDGTTGDMRMYVNGVLIGTDTHIGSGVLIDTGNPMYIGRDGNIGSKKFEGELDEVRIYNKALTVQEINDQLCTELTGNEDGLVAYYDFNNIGSPNTGTIVPDNAPLDGNTNGTIRNGGAANISYPTAQITCPNSGFENNRSCDSATPNGVVDLSDKISPLPGGSVAYDFEIYDGFSTAGTPVDANTTGVFTGLPGGFYTVIATDQATGCVTLDGRVSLNDIPDNPAIATVVTDDIGCSTIGLGEIAVTSSSSSVEPAGGYTYEIFDGFNFTTEIGSDIPVADGSIGHTYTGLTDGQYRIRVTNADLTCTSFVDVNVGDNPTNPSWNHASTIINDNTACGGTPNGFVSVAVAGGNTDFTFEWYNGSIVDAGQLIAGENDEFLDELAGGLQYTVVATSTITGCPTPPNTLTVNNNPILPNVIVVEVQPQNSCDVGDGILRAYVDEPDPSDCVECVEEDDYTFQWFLGNDTSTPLIEATDPGNNSNPTYVDSSRVEGLSGAYEYTVLVTNSITGCTNEATINLTYDPLPPEIDAANSQVTANTLCGPVGNGSVVAAVNFVGETINGAINDRTWDIITDCNTITDLNSSILPDGSIELTPDVNNQAGKAYLGDSVDFSKPTRIDYWMYLGDKDAGGADGITFIFHQDPAGRDALGRYGCNLGIGDEPCFGGSETAIQPSIAVEFDTWNNGGATKDPAWDHMAFVVNGDMSEPQGDVGVFYNANQPRIINGQDDVETDTELRVTITIVPNLDGTQTFSVYVEDELRMQRTQNFIQEIFNNNPLTIGGFTASTGGARNQQYVRLDPYFGEYDFDWYTGSSVDPANEIVGADRPFLCDLLGGDYTLVVTYGGSGCTSSPPNTFTIPNDTDTATISFSGLANDVCDPTLAVGGMYTGSLSANILEDPADYVFAWFEGSAPTTDTLATTQAINNIPGGNYTVVVESLAGGCVAVRDTTLADDTNDPAILNVNADVIVQNVSSCEGGLNYPNGSISVINVDGSGGPYGYWYYFGSDTTSGVFLDDNDDIFTQTGEPGTSTIDVVGNGTSTLSNLSAGDYSIIVIDLSSGCTSIVSNVSIIDEPTIPDLDQDVTANSVCDITANTSGQYNGEVEIITLDGSDAVADYSYDWYEGTGTSTAISVGSISNNILSQAPNGNYTVVATSVSTGCDTTIYATIGDATVDPVIGTVNVTDMSVCDGATVFPNGAIEVDESTITNGSGDYSYEFYWGGSVDPAQILANGDNIVEEKTGTANGVAIDITNNVISNLDTGFYTIVVIDNVTGCTASEVSVEIEDILIPINVSLAAAITHYTNCDAPNGSISVNAAMASGPAPTGGFSYEWFFGSGTTDPLDASDLTDGTALSGENTATVSGLEDGTYTVLVTNNDTECTETAEYDVEDNRVYPVIDPTGIVVTDNINCTGPGTGTIDATNAITPATGIYRFTLFDDADVQIDFEDMTGADDGIFENLSAGNYRVGVELVGTGCTSVSTAAVEVENNLTFPNLTLTKLSDETSCIAPNGQIRVNDPSSAPAAGFNISLYVGVGTGGMLQETIANNYTGAFPISSSATLPNGTYTVQMINNDTGCESTAQITIIEVSDTPTLAAGDVSTTNDTNCTSDNGTIVISTATNPGTDPIYSLYTGSSTDPANLVTTAQPGITNHTFNGLGAGTYTVSVTKDESGCESNGITRTINEVPVSFTPGVTTVSNQSSCLISNPNGELQAAITAQGTGPSTNLSDYNFEWYQGQNTNPLNRINSGGIISTAIVSGTNGSEVTGLPTGTYRLRVIEPVSGCFYTVDATIMLVTQTPTILGGGPVVTDADQCAPSNGEIEVTVDNGGSTQPNDGEAGYTFEIYDGTISPMETPLQSQSVTAVAGANNEATYTFTGLEPGDYTIEITDNNTSCLVTSTLQTVGFTGATLAFDPNNMANTPLTGCFGNDGTLDVGTSLTIPGNFDDVIITWFIGTDTSNTANLVSNVVTGPPAAAFSDIPNYDGLGYNIINGIVDNLPAVSYTGVAELTNGCKFLLEFDLSIVDAPDLLTAVTTPVSRCSPTYDGEVTLTVTPNNGNNAGFYNYYVYPGSFTVTDVTPGPNWDPPANSYNSGVTAGLNGSGTFTNNGADVADAVTVTELDSGTYTVIIEINTGTGCVTNVETITIGPPTEAAVTLDTKVDNTVCDTGAPLNLDYNGSITVDAEHPDFAGSTFTFEWYYDDNGGGFAADGSDQEPVLNGADGAGIGSFVTGAITPDNLTATLTGIGPGWYRVIATHTDANNGGADATACPDTLDIEIFNDFVDFEIIEVDNITIQTNVLDCGGGPQEFGEFILEDVYENGIEVDATAGAGNFNITWEYDDLSGGGFTSYPVVSQNTSNTLEAGDYRLNIVSTSTGCDISYEFTIEDETEDPVINLLNLSDNTICVGGPLGLEADGQIVIEIQDELGAFQNPADYDVTWYLGGIGVGNDIPTSQVMGASISTTAADITVDDLPGGTYWVEVVKNNGNNEECTAVASFVLQDDPAEVSIQQVLGTDFTRQNQTECNPDENGALTLLNVYEDGAADLVANNNYLFNWYDDLAGTLALSSGSISGLNNETVTGLPAGTYYVEAENRNTDCVSDIVAFTIENDAVDPNLQLTQTLPDTTCVGSLVPSGEVTASVILPGGGAADPNDYIFTWYEGSGTGTPISVGSVDPGAVNDESYIELPAGVYTVVVEDDTPPGNNCVSTAEIAVTRFTPVISIANADITVQNDVDCSLDVGSATVDAVTITRFGGGSYRVTSLDVAFADFDFNWFFSATGGTSQDNDNTWDLRPAGTYFVTAENTQTGCSMATRKAVNIQEVTSNPLVQLVSRTPDTYCNPTNPEDGDGYLNIRIVHESLNPADSADYNITWYRGAGTSTLLAGTGTASISPNGTGASGLSAGTYTVTITDNVTPNLGCEVTQTFTINRDEPIVSLPVSAFTIQDNLNCMAATPNGSITIDGIFIDGFFEDFGTTADTYTINWSGLPLGASINAPGINQPNDQVTLLEGGVYTVDITNDRTRCSTSADIAVDDVTSNPLVQLVIKQADEFCDNTGFAGNGSLEMRIVHEGNNPADPLDYNIQWFRGNTTAVTLASQAGTSAVAGDGTILTGLSTDTYTVQVTKNNAPNDQCFAITTFSIVKDEPAFSIQTTSIQKTDNTNCAPPSMPNGTIQITNVITDGVVTDLSTVPLGTYSFTWLPMGLNGGSNVTVNQTDDRAVDLPAGTYQIIARNVTTGCPTDTISVSILDDQTEPLLSFNVDQVNTNCGTTKNGQLTVTATTADGNPNTNVGRYTFNWFIGQGTGVSNGTYPQIDGSGANDNQSTLLELDSGYYTVTVFDSFTGCDITGTYAVSETLVTPQVLLADIVVRPDTTCDVGSSGTIIVADSSFDTGVLDDYDVEIRPNTPNPLVSPIAFSSPGSGATDLTISTLEPGVYYVTATLVSTGCVAAPVRINILDQRFPPDLLLDTLIANVNCGGSSAGGSLRVLADGFDHTNPDYVFQWYIGQTVGVVVPGGNGGNTANPFNLAEGFYTLEVENNNTGCVVTQVFEIPSIQQLPTFSSYEVNNNTACVDNGSIVLLEGLFGTTVIDSLALASDYTVGWFSNPGLTTVVADPVPGTPLELEGLGAGTYYVTLTNDTTNCTSAPLELVLTDNVLFPSINGIQLAADSTCIMTGTTPTGVLRAIVDNQNNPGPNYQFTWYAASDLTTPLSNDDTLSGQFAGDYVVEVTNTDIGCTSTETFTIQSRPVNIVINNVVSTAPTNCMPPNGILEVTDVSYGVLSDYTFEFRDDDDNVLQSSADSIYSGAASGRYRVFATHNRLGCINPLVYGVVVDDGNLVFPEIMLASFENQTNCDPGNPNGELSATADGTTNTTDYTFEWRNSANTVVAANSASITNIPADEYTLNVTNNSTGCVSSNSFDIVDDFPMPLELVISTSPNRNCVDPSGEVSATVRNLQALGNPITDYVFYWFVGDQTASIPDITNPDFQGTLWTDLPGGEYTVYVVDATDVFCTSEPTLVVVPDETLPPPFEVEVTNDVTICYEDMRDGRARIDVNSLEPNRDLFEFRYEWYQGTVADTAGQVPFVTGIRADSLDIGTYSVVSTDLRTGCTNLVSFDIIDDTDAVPAPDVIVISDRDNCAFANGNARASISGEINDYRFEWFLAAGDTTTVQFTGHEVFTLDSINYTVQATRISTGCVSPRTPVEIINAIEDPVFEIEATTTMCLRTEDGAFNQFTGEAIIRFSEFIPIKEIEWIAPDGTVFSNDIKLVNAQPGLWSVRFIADNDCEYTGVFRIETELKIYNGVSANGDGRNDFFFVDCIDYFPNNKVQIFNRDGTRVWESNGYDNVNVRFEGFSNIGIGGLQLPAGTYFYIIEKGEQVDLQDAEGTLTDPTIRPRLQGYLELVR